MGSDRQGATSQKQQGEPVAFQDWEQRALPSDARCRVWAEEGGLWYVVTEEPRIVGSPCLIAIGWHQEPRWRPIRANGDPAPWSEFLSATHPPIPEGWEKAGEWTTAGTVGGKPFTIKERGENDFGSLHSGDGYRISIRRVPPPVDWGDVPKGVDMRPTWGGGGPCNDVILNGAYVGRVLDQSEEGYSTHGTDQRPVEGSPFASLPAAIVALTGRRTG